jgi:regulator of replication initiation timing
MKKMAALQKQLDEIREKLKSKDELIEILIKENEALKLRLDYEKREAAKAHEIVPRAYRRQLPFCGLWL